MKLDTFDVIAKHKVSQFCGILLIHHGTMAKIFISLDLSLNRGVSCE
jgi:hypothetical protein